MEDVLRTVGYLCPKCGQKVQSGFRLFSLTTTAITAACPCGGSALTTEPNGRRFTVTVPCRFCGNSHAAVCSVDQLIEKTIGLNCKRTGYFCCYLGSPESVEKELSKAEALSKRDAARGQAAFLDDTIMYEVLAEIKDIASRPDGITCGCGNRTYKIQMNRASVDLICGKCGSRLRIPAASDQDLDDLCCHMRLEIPGGNRDN